MRFRILNIVAVLTLAVFILVRLPWWYYLLLGWAYISIVFYGCVSISSGFFLPVACKAKTNEKIVALSFDDGPHPAYSAQILDILSKYNVPATFFCIGKNINGNEHLLQRIKNEGHIIGNHSYSHHFWFDMFRSKKMLADMRQTDETVMKAAGRRPLLFRPPYGVMNPNLAKAIKKGGYTPIGWSVRSFDTAIKDKQKLLLRITKQMRAGDIILLHDSMEITANMLPELIEQMQSKGFRIERLDKMLNITPYA